MLAVTGFMHGFMHHCFTQLFKMLVTGSLLLMCFTFRDTSSSKAATYNNGGPGLHHCFAQAFKMVVTGWQPVVDVLHLQG